MGTSDKRSSPTEGSNRSLAGQPAVDDGRNTGNRERRLGNVGREHDFAAIAIGEHSVLLFRRQVTVKLKQLEVVPAGKGLQLGARLANFTDARKENEDVPLRSLRHLVHSGGDERT